MAERLRRIVVGAKRGKAKNRVGLDVGKHSIKMVELSDQAGAASLISFGTKRIKGSSQEEVVASVKSLAEALRISAKEVNISSSGPSLVVRLVSMPKMTDEELAGAVRFEAEKFVPFDINDCILDFQILNKETDGKNNVDILLAAAKKEHVLQSIKTVEEAGFSVRTVDVDIFAIINSFLRNFPSLEQSKTFALLNIGAISTELSIVCNNLPVFVREIAMGGNDFSAAIAKATGLSQEIAEELKIAPKDKRDEVLNCTKPVIISLFDEVRLSFGYYENHSGRGIDEIFVSGGGSGMIGLAELMQESFGSKPNYWDPFQFLDKSSSTVDTKALEELKSSFCVAVGLALR